MLEGHRVCNENLSREAVKRGVSRERIIFAPKMENSRHLARIGLGDLFVDTLPVNAHTTASDALWAGLPVLTCVGEAFVSRVAGSLLHAVGLPELVTQSLAEYEAKAFELTRDPAQLKTLRDRLQINRLTMPLFDSVRYTRHYEAALLKMAELRDAGQPPQAFDVKSLD
jgi:predicted O-linked N-acetylglucosamine transferase (SPINDLY family)